MSDNAEYELPVLILAVSKEAGEAYAKVLRVPNYRVEINPERIQGRRIRSIIVSPGYLERASEAYHKEMTAYYFGLQTVLMHNPHNG